MSQVAAHSRPKAELTASSRLGMLCLIDPAEWNYTAEVPGYGKAWERHKLAQISCFGHACYMPVVS